MENTNNGMLLNNNCSNNPNNGIYLYYSYNNTYIGVEYIIKESSEEFPLTTILIAISSFGGGIGLAVMSILILRKRKRISKGA